MTEYKYKCNNTGCPKMIRTGQPLVTNEVDPCPMCGHHVVDAETGEVAKTKVVEYNANKIYYEDTPREENTENENE